MTIACERCRWAKDHTSIIESKVDGVAEYSVGHAELILFKQPRKAVEIPLSRIGKLVRPKHVDAEHVEHVRSDKPGIIAYVSHVKGVRWALIDGNHRATKCLYENRKFTAYILTPKESEKVIIRKLTRKGKAKGK